MAFMMPVMKNNFDIYNGSRSRKTSECSNPSGCNSRKVSESKSEGPSLSTSPGNDYSSHHHQQQRHHIQRSFSSKPFSRTHSRTSQGSFVTSPTRTSLPASATATSSSPPKPAAKSKSNNNGSEGSINKLFHLRLVDKLRKSLRKDSSTERS